VLVGDDQHLAGAGDVRRRQRREAPARRADPRVPARPDSLQRALQRRLEPAVEALHPARLEVCAAGRGRIDRDTRVLESPDDLLPGFFRRGRVGIDEPERRTGRERLPQAHTRPDARSLRGGGDRPEQRLGPRLGSERRGLGLQARPLPQRGSQLESRDDDARDHEHVFYTNRCSHVKSEVVRNRVLESGCVREEPFELPVDGGAIRGHRAGGGRPALLLHGGAAVPDYLGPCAELLDGLFETVRYTQRGTPPSEAPPPYTIESHVADALAVLERFGLERAWAIGHSWGGHLALHLVLADPKRIAGVVCIDPIGADPSVFAAFEAKLDEALSADDRARVREIEGRRRSGDVTEAELVERFRLVWPVYFARAARASPPPARVGAQASIETNRSLAEHFERRTLAHRLPEVRAPALFVHGEDDPLPPESATVTAALIPGAFVETIPDSGHFPWLEQPDAFRATVERLLARVRA
jgi:pimeloyl-ACP methyl ester carboxylesterase